MGKRILLLMPTFQGLYKLVVAELERQQYAVTFVELPAFLNLMEPNPIICRLKKILRPTNQKKQQKIFCAEVDTKKFDVLLAIGGFFTSQKYINKVKEKNPQIKTVIFYWDSFAVWDYSCSIEWFDKRYSFDYADCESNKDKKLEYLCNFYIDNARTADKVVYDVCHIGTLTYQTVNRLHILYNIKKQADSIGIKNYIRLYLPNLPSGDWFTSVTQIVRKLFISKYRAYIKKIKEVTTSQYNIITDETIPLEECIYIEKHSKCIIDVPANCQCGHTIRSLNALASQQKLITTDSTFKNETFYDANNILIIDKQNVVLDTNFLSLPYKTVDTSSLLNLEMWLKKLIND